MRALLFLLGLLAAVPAQAQSKLLQAHAASGSAFVGQGDILTPWTDFYSLRAFNAAYATGSNKSANIRRASDNSAQDINILSNGNFDLASYNTFVGTDATASCTIAGTVVACTGASATLHVNDPITGVGITNPCVVTVTNGSTTATASLAGTSTSCGTVSVAETVTFQVAGFLPKWYDQSGSITDAAQVTAGNQPQLLQNCQNSLPCVFFNGSYFLTASPSGVAAPYMWYSVLERVGNFSSFNIYLEASSASSTLSSNNSANFARLAATTGLTAAMSDSASHVLLGIVAGAGNGTINVDNTLTSVAVGNTATAASLTIGARAGPSLQMTGYMFESGLQPSAPTTGNQTSVCHNGFAYWATSTSC